MKYCPYCGTANPDQNMICEACGAQLINTENENAAATEQQPYQQPVQQPYQQPYQQPVQQTYQQPAQQTYQPVYQPYQQTQSTAPRYSNGGLIAWSVITILLCTIPGVIAMINACQINSCATVEQQESKIKTARTCCLIGTILGVIAVIANIIIQNS